MDGIEERIKKTLKTFDKEFVSVKELQEKMEESYSTILKYVDLMAARKEIEVNDFGNIKLIRVKQNG